MSLFKPAFCSRDAGRGGLEDDDDDCWHAFRAAPPPATPAFLPLQHPIRPHRGAPGTRGPGGHPSSVLRPAPDHPPGAAMPVSPLQRFCSSPACTPSAAQQSCRPLPGPDGTIPTRPAKFLLLSRSPLLQIVFALDGSEMNSVLAQWASEALLQPSDRVTLLHRRARQPGAGSEQSHHSHILLFPAAVCAEPSSVRTCFSGVLPCQAVT